MASLILFVSCQQYDTNIEKQSFDNKAFETFKNNPYLENVLNSVKKHKSKSNTVLGRNTQILNAINSELGTNLTIPNEVLSLSTDIDAEEIYSISLENGLLNHRDVELSKELVGLIEANGVEMAINKYENKISSLNLSNEDFAKHNLIVNTIKSLNYENPAMFTNTEYLAKFSWWRCSLAALALTAAIANMSTCATIVACGVATLLLVNAGYAVGDHCDPE
jgi:hypothetical protein